MLAPPRPRDSIPPRQRSSMPVSPRFHKYHALGNDYIVLDPIDWPDAPDPELVRRGMRPACGVGADGVLWGPIPDGRDAFRLRLFNPDGEEFEKSGNGLRIFARYLWDRGLPAGVDFVIDTAGGPVTAHVLEATATHIAMEMVGSPSTAGSSPSRALRETSSKSR